MKCSKCGSVLKDGAYFCPVCGAVVSSGGSQQPPPSAEPTAPCPQCGAPVKAGAEYCGQCGTKIFKARIIDAAPPMQKKMNGAIIAAIIAGALILVGGIAFLVWFLLGGSAPSPNPQPSVTAMPMPTSNNSGGSVTPQTTPTPTAVYSAPVFPHITASSTRKVDYTSGSAVYYPVEYAVDGNFDTCWSPDRKISLTPTLTLSADTPQHVTGIRLSNGYFKTSETYTKNRRITRAEIKYNGGSKIVDMSIDSYRIMQDIVFDSPVDTTYIEIHILNTYDGVWHDICISEVEVY